MYLSSSQRHNEILVSRYKMPTVLYWSIIVSMIHFVVSPIVLNNAWFSISLWHSFFSLLLFLLPDFLLRQSRPICKSYIQHIICELWEIHTFIAKDPYLSSSAYFCFLKFLIQRNMSVPWKKSFRPWTWNT